MTTLVEIDADLRLAIELPGHDPVTATLTGQGRSLELAISDPVVFAGRRDAGVVRGIAAALAERGIVLTVVAGGRRLLELGAVDGSWLQRRITRSRHLRVVGVRGAIAGVRGRASDEAPALPGRALVPPPTLFPVAPTFGRPPKPVVTTTHDPRRGGNPRLVLTVGNTRLPESRKVIHPLRGEVVTIGSGEDCDIRLAGLAALHAEVRHDARDEYVLVDRAGRRTTRVNGVPVDERLLRTGARVELGDWVLAYRREEYADHGRPYGGRIGGELGHQKPQPGRHRLQHVTPAPERNP